jgi:predicted MFS family arabinose efflux permease
VRSRARCPPAGRPTSRRPGRAVVVAVAGWGLAITAFGLSTTSFPLALFFLAPAGTADVISAVLRSGIFELETPDELRGRVSSVHILVATSGPRIGDAEAAAVAAVFGPQFSVVSGGILCLAGLAGVVRAFPELMRYRSSPTEPTLKSAAEIVRLPFELDSSETEIDPPIG